MYDFNPRSREGSDVVRAIQVFALSQFQSTLPRGERLFHSFLSRPILHYFNPRSREGSDSAVLALVPISSQFQSTLPRGERRYLNPRIVVNGTISIHAPARGATHPFRFLFPSSRYFNPRSREGSDSPPLPVPAFLCYFNPRSREGSDLLAAERAAECKYFNPRSREGSDRFLLMPLLLPLHFNPRSREGSDFIR